MGRCTAFLLLLASVGCGGGDDDGESDNPYVGNMSDTSYSGRRGKPYTPTAAGGSLALESFEGKFVWVDYAATWCKPCAHQAPVIRKLETSMGDEIVFLTIMTSANVNVAGPSATQKTAQGWARRYGFAPEHVAASDLWGMTIPTHIFYSPKGHTLFRKKGYHSEEQIRKIISDRRADWKAWAEKGTVAGWMKSRE